MAVEFDPVFAEWVKQVLARHRVKSARQAEIRSGVNYTTIGGMMKGRKPGAEIVIRFATAYGEDVPDALRLAGHGSVADAWESGGGVRSDEIREPGREYHIAEQIIPEGYEGYIDLTEENRAKAAEFVELLLMKQKVEGVEEL